MPLSVLDPRSKIFDPRRNANSGTERGKENEQPNVLKREEGETGQEKKYSRRMRLEYEKLNCGCWHVFS